MTATAEERENYPGERREIAQDRFLNDLVNEMHSVTKDDEEYRVVFARVCIDLIQFVSDLPRKGEDASLYLKTVAPALKRFAPNMAERKYLAARLLEQLVSSALLTGALGNYRRAAAQGGAPGAASV